MTNRKNILPVLALIFTVILWGLSFLSIKVAIQVVPPMMLGLIRFIIAAVFLNIVIRIKEPTTKLKRKDIPLMALSGFLGVTLYFYFENNGVKLLEASTASLIIATIPIFTLIFEAAVFKLRLTKYKLLSVIISFAGVYFIVDANIYELVSTNTGIGYIFMFGAVLSWVIYTLVTKPLFNKYSQLAIVYYQALFGMIFFIPFAVFETVNLSSINGIVIFNILYLGLFCSAIAYYTYVYAMDHLGVSTSSLYLNVMPVITILGSFFILNEEISLNQIIGGILVVAAVYLINIKENKQEEVIENTPLP
jgi:drug/metabolite transporter (DMT)-like permease